MEPTTTLCVIRHGLAGESLADRALDDARPLTARGLAQARRAGAALAGLRLLPHGLWTSPLRRAVETARAAATAAGARAAPRETDALEPEAPPGRALATLLEAAGARAATGPEVHWLVGHQPHLSAFVALCLRELPHDLRIAKGDVVVLEAAGTGAAAGAFRLAHHLPAAELEARGDPGGERPRA
jgi:phosphohistidine phosphatase SixA